jgi:phosphatidyl-myo-inositol dimannoside synthase
MTARALLLSPSGGLGGGIERYVETVEWALAEQGVEYARVDLYQRDGQGRASAYTHLLAKARSYLSASDAPTRLIAAHSNLLPATSLLARHRLACGVSVICHGAELWGDHPQLRDRVEKHLMRRPGVRVIAVSNFTAGVLSDICQATILPPGLSQDWFQLLVEESATSHKSCQGVHLMTAFRLGTWDSKGLPELLSAVASLGRADVKVTVCGNGEPPPGLVALIRTYPFCSLRPRLSDRELASALAAADLFVLATRMQLGRHASGEGFGLVLLEAQVAGTPVVAPAYGGSHDAYVDQVTGVAPADETTEALAKTLDELLDDPGRLAQMGKQAAEWARESFAPGRYASRAVTALL